MPESRHILTTFDAALAALLNDVLFMGSLADQALVNAMRGLLDRDDDLCNRTIADDDHIDQLENKVQRDGIEVLMRFQPLAADLRQVVCGMRLSSDIERVADQAANIAKRTRQLNRRPALEEAAVLEPMFLEASILFKDSLRAYAEADVESAMALKKRDKRLDELNLQVSELVAERMAKNPERIRDYMNVVFIARYLERIGDHAKNIGEDAVFAAVAEEIRHQKRS